MNEMKWPQWLMLIRHDTSAYNILKDKKKEDPLYQQYLEEYKKDFCSPVAVELAKELLQKYSLDGGSADTPIVDPDGQQPFKTGRALQKDFELPDVIFVSPYVRTRQTLDHLVRGWPELKNVQVYEEDRIREQEHGLAMLYNDWRFFHTLNPEQKQLQDAEGMYWYRYPQGESVCDVRNRTRQWMSTFTREFSNKRVLAVTHHLVILALRANFERLDATEFLRLDHEEKPINSGVTLYKGYPDEGAAGRLKLDFYNKKFY